MSDVSTDLDVLLSDGFVVVEGGIRQELCGDANADLDGFKELNRDAVAPSLDEAGRMYRIVNLHLALDSLAVLFSENPALEICDRFFNAETALYTSLFFERGSEQNLHRDAPVFVTQPPGRYLGVWVALDDVDSENGPLVVVPGSHKLPNVDVSAMAVELYGDPASAPEFDQIGWDTYQNVVREQAEVHGLEPVELFVGRGDVVVWHPMLFHGGAQHRSADRTRRSLVMHVTPLGVPVYHQDVFFNPERDVAASAPWGYFGHQNRQIAHFNEVQFSEKHSQPVASLQSPRQTTHTNSTSA